MVNIVIKTGWKDPIKSCILRLLQTTMANLNCTSKDMLHYFRLPQMIKEQIIAQSNVLSKGAEVKNDGDSDLEILNDTVANKENNDNNNNNSNVIDDADDEDTAINDDSCWEDISDKIWEILTNKLDLNGQNKKISQLNADFIILTLRFIKFNEGHWDEKYTQNVLRLFEVGYNDVRDQVKKDIILKLKRNEFSWRMLDNYHGSIGDVEYEKFLKSNRSSFTKMGFRSIIQARKWASTCFRSQKYCSVKVEKARGSGRRARVEVSKTSAYWNKKILNKFHDTYGQFNTIFPLIK